MVEHYFSRSPKVAPREKVVEAFLAGRKFRFLTSSGVFSPKDIDNGTRLLIEHMEIRRVDRVCDLGCGYGPVGLAAAVMAADGKVLMLDVNKRAVALARENIRENGIKNATAVGSAFSEVKERFDVVLCNPPLSAGKDVVKEMFAGAFEHLDERGRFFAVVRKGHNIYREMLESIFGNCEILSRSAGYRVFKACRS